MTLTLHGVGKNPDIVIYLTNPAPAAAPIPAGEAVESEAGVFAATEEVPGGTELVSTPVTEPGEESAAQVAVQVAAVLGEDAEAPVYFEIHLEAKGEKVEAGAEVTLKTSIALPERDGVVGQVKELRVFHVLDDGSVETIAPNDYTVEDGVITSIHFYTPSFSLFGVYRIVLGALVLLIFLTNFL